MVRTNLALALLLAASLAASSAEIISDIAPDLNLNSAVDEKQALQVKADEFWKPVMRAVEDMGMIEHLQLYEDAKLVISALPAANEYVRTALREALERLQRADKLVLAQAARSSNLGSPTPWDVAFSFLKGGQNPLAQAVRRFVNGGQYSETLQEQVKGRQADILPMLRDAASATGNVLEDCRLASKRSFDSLKYDLYNKGVPKTPEYAKSLAHRLVKAAGQTRHKFTSFITESAKSIARDVERKSERPVVTLVQKGLQRFGQKEQAQRPAITPSLDSGPDDIVSIV